MDLYKILEIKKDADQQEIKKAYRDMSKKHHPDVGGDERKFHTINLAYRVLSDPEKRKLYDDQGIIMDESPDHINNMVNVRLAAIAEKWIDNMLKGKRISLQQFVLEGIRVGIKIINRENSKIKISIDKLKNIRDRIIYEDDNSIFHKVINNRINNYKKGINQNKMELVILKQLEITIKDYNYDEEILMNTGMFNTLKYTTY